MKGARYKIIRLNAQKGLACVFDFIEGRAFTASAYAAQLYETEDV